MSFDQLLFLAQRLGSSVDALAALTASLRIRTEGLSPDPSTKRALEAVWSALGAPPLDDLPAEKLKMAAGAIRSSLRQAVDFVDHPDRAAGWVHDDPIVLQSQGRASMLLAGLMQKVAPQLLGLPERLASPDAAFLDIGTGVGWLAVAMARAFPTLRVVGIDVWDPALALARDNVAASGATDRIEIRKEDACELRESSAFDLVWFPSPFIPRSIVPTAVDRAHRALRSNGWMIFGISVAAPEPLAQRLNELRTVRSGGYAWSEPEAKELLRVHDFVDVRAVERTWSEPVAFVTGRTP